MVTAAAFPRHGPETMARGMDDKPARDQEMPPSGEVPAAADPQATPLSLLHRLRANDKMAWRQVVQLYDPLVRYWSQRTGLRGADVEDVTQEVFAAAAANLTGFRKDRVGDTFRGWLRTITRNQVTLHFRRIQGRPQAEGGSDALHNLQEIAERVEEPDSEERREIHQVYRRALEQVRCQFEERTWQAFWLTAVEGRAPADLGEELGMSPAAIRQAKSRVLRRLKQEMGELLG